MTDLRKCFNPPAFQKDHEASAILEREVRQKMSGEADEARGAFFDDIRSLRLAMTGVNEEPAASAARAAD
jgi:hypothetical protein